MSVCKASVGTKGQKLSSFGQQAWRRHSNCIMKDWYWFENREEKAISHRVIRNKCNISVAEKSILIHKITWLRVGVCEIEHWRECGSVDWGDVSNSRLLLHAHARLNSINSERYFVLQTFIYSEIRMPVAVMTSLLMHTKISKVAQAAWNKMTILKMLPH